MASEQENPKVYNRRSREKRPQPDENNAEFSDTNEHELQNIKDSQQTTEQPQIVESADDKPGEDITDGHDKSIPITALLPVFITMLLVIIMVLISSGKISLFNNSNGNIDFESSFKLLKNGFQNQSPETFRKLKSRMSRYIRHATAPQPFVLLVASKQGNHPIAHCFAKCVAKLFTTASVTVNGSHYAEIPSDDAKLKIDDHLRDVFQKNMFPTIAIINNFDLIPYGATNLFYAYCDHDNPMYKEAAIIFTVTLPEKYQINDNEHDRERLVEKYLSEDSKWVKENDFSIDVMGALISRITDTVIIINNENIDSWTNLCFQYTSDQKSGLGL